MNISRFAWTGAVVGLLVVGCGDDPAGPAASRNDPGTGSSTLHVTADVDASDVPGGFVTELRVELRDLVDDPVSGATVTIANSGFGVVALLETSAGSGEYAASRTSFPGGDFALSVVRGTDGVSGVVLGGPGVHSITAPLANDTLSALTAMDIAWSVPSQARSVEVETRDFGPVLAVDVGSYTVPSVQNEIRPDQRIRIYRFNEVDIAGGLLGSRMRVKVRQSVEPIVVQ